MECSIAHAVLQPGQRSRPHRLRTRAKVYFILSGAGHITVNEEQADVHAGQAVYIPPNAVQMLENTEDRILSFLAIVSPVWHEEDEDVLEENG